jgi:hypothetical protein
MHNQLVTPFWKNALESLPATLRPRYASQLAAAERWELWLDAIVELWSRMKHRPRARNLNGPRAA